MIEILRMYGAVCDNCGEIHTEDDIIIAWNDKSYVKENAENNDWVFDEDNKSN